MRVVWTQAQWRSDAVVRTTNSRQGDPGSSRDLQFTQVYERVHNVWFMSYASVIKCVISAGCNSIIALISVFV